MPYGEVLADMVPSNAVRMRRDFQQLITAIKTIAILNQEHREKKPDGKVVATIADYTEARRLLSPLFDIIAAEGVTGVVRQTVEAVPQTGEISQADLARLLQTSRQVTSYRVRQAIKGGWLRNLEEHKGYPARLRRGDPLPDEVSALPEPKEVEAEVSKRKSFQTPF